MVQQPGLEEQDNVVVIEERDKNSLFYIIVAAILGLALGGLIGSLATQKQWEARYQILEDQYHQQQASQSQLVSDIEKRAADIDSQQQEQIMLALEEQSEKHKTELAKVQSMTRELEKINLSLEEQLKSQQSELVKTTENNDKLTRQADIQASMFDRSKELFLREASIQKDLEKLEQEKQSLLPKLNTLRKECDVYLEGTSWDSKSDSCDKQDEANSRLSQIEQLISIHLMDLKQIKRLTDELGIN
ncbi:chromosome partitioning protein ParA [Vibrio sp. 10N.286.49.B3]|uniref:chromosome partitioning protein ParA n=1 Tax=Vibrio sp. 10N.286.49.B3 TaxID=1880855 RepID=UPI000C850632|nr:chromosome partitioning protein ParA [Vibrio sp. 10N.286.49.B3]PMH44922.1 chromosome partitioning protein ParA [Vibrio sp. 10N.286.49.B3]